MTRTLCSCASRPRKAGLGLLALSLALTFCALAGGPRPARADTPETLFAAGRFEPARAGYTQAALAAPLDPAPRLGLVRALLRLDRWPEAVTEAQAAASKFPQNADAHGLYALTLIRAGWQPPCVDEARRALALDAQDYWGLVAEGRLADWDGKEADARALFRKACAARPELPDAWLGLIETRGEAEDLKETGAAVLAYLKTAPRGHPHDVEVAGLKEFGDGAAAYRKAFETGPPFRREADAQGADRKEAGSTTLNVEFVGDYAVFPVTLNGQKFRLLFDTGGGHGIALAKNPARRLNLTPIAHGSLRGGSGAEPSDTLRADTLALGDLRFRSILIHTMRDTVAGADGILSGEVLDDSVVTLDYGTATATMTHGTGAAAPPVRAGDAAITLPFRLYHNHLFARVSLNTVPIWAMLDTGAQESFLSLRLAREQLKTLPKDQVRAGTMNERHAIGNGPRAEYIYSPAESNITLSETPPVGVMTPTIGISDLDRQVSPPYDFEIGMLLGVSSFTYAQRVTFDYPRRLLTFEFKDVPEPPAPKKK